MAAAIEVEAFGLVEFVSSARALLAACRVLATLPPSAWSAGVGPIEAGHGYRRLPTAHALAIAELTHEVGSLADFCALDYSTATDLADGVASAISDWIPAPATKASDGESHNFSDLQSEGEDSGSSSDSDDHRRGGAAPADLTLPLDPLALLVTGLRGSDLLLHLACCVARRVFLLLDAAASVTSAQPVVASADREAVVNTPGFAERAWTLLGENRESGWATGALLDRGSARLPSGALARVLADWSNALGSVPPPHQGRPTPLDPLAVLARRVVMDAIGPPAASSPLPLLDHIPRPRLWAIARAARGVLLTLAQRAVAASEPAPVHHALVDGGQVIEISLADWYRLAADDAMLRSRILLAARPLDAAEQGHTSHSAHAAETLALKNVLRRLPAAAVAPAAVLLDGRLGALHDNRFTDLVFDEVLGLLDEPRTGRAAASDARRLRPRHMVRGQLTGDREGTGAADAVALLANGRHRRHRAVPRRERSGGDQPLRDGVCGRRGVHVHQLRTRRHRRSRQHLAEHGSSHRNRH
jgi:hypothetical protein